MLEPCPSKSCPFCGRSFKALGIHLKHCPKREGQDYQAYLSGKARSKNQDAPKMKVCDNCGRSFKRLDAHLRLRVSVMNINKLQKACIFISADLRPTNSVQGLSGSMVVVLSS